MARGLEKFDLDAWPFVLFLLCIADCLALLSAIWMPLLGLGLFWFGIE